MPLLLNLFLTFLKIGAVSFGGGYGMISLIREEVLSNGWATEEAFMNFIAVAESTPGPIAVNMATFIGSTTYDISWLGGLVATLGVILPSFIIILLIASLLRGFLKYKGVKAVLQGIHPTVAGLITATGITMILSVLLGISNIQSAVTINYKSIIIMGLILLVAFGYKKFTKKKISPILLIVISAVLGILFFSF